MTTRSLKETAFVIFGLFILLAAIGCKTENSISKSGQSIGGSLMDQLSDFIEEVAFDDVGAISLQSSDGSVVWSVEEVDQNSWSNFRKVLGEYIRKLDANQLGAVQPTHKLVARVSFIELHIDLFTVSDRQDGGNDLLERLGKLFGKSKNSVD